jgi:hypothetical protein
MAGVPVPPPAGVGAPAVAVPAQVCVPGLPAGATSLAKINTKIGVVYVPMNSEGHPMFEHLTKQQQNAVKAELGDYLAKASAGGICGLILCCIFCPPCACYFLIMSMCCVGYQMTTFGKKLKAYQVEPVSHVGAWQAQQSAAVAAGGVALPGAVAPVGGAAVTTAPVTVAPPTASQV